MLIILIANIGIFVKNDRKNFTHGLSDSPVIAEFIGWNEKVMEKLDEQMDTRF